ncbi:MAG TPA: FAD-binding oxidoreductase [Lachnospiraceae bacterium]|nr:FAD-binding oxidoreductase [Lachnospiraceae bacterium]
MELIKPFSDEYMDYLRDESRTVGYADSISFPKTEEEIVSILKYLYQNNTAITVQGARTGLVAAAVPFGGHILNISKMDKILGCRKDQKNFYLTIEPGVILMELNKKISSKKFDTTSWNEISLEAYNSFLSSPPMFFTPDPTENTATLGGMVACNASGARSFMYGATRNHITAIRLALADGRIVSLKRGETFANLRTLTITTQNGDNITLDLPKYEMPNTKNASGYFVKDNMDAIDLFIGSDSTLGVITELEIALTPLPPHIWGISCFFESEIKAIKFVQLVRYKIEGVAAMEYFDQTALNLLRNQKESGTAFAQLPDVPYNYNCCVYIELHANTEESIEGKMFEVGEKMELAGGNLDDTWVARNENDIDCLHFLRHAAPESANMIIDQRKKTDPMITKLGTDMSVPDQFLEEVFDLYRSGLEENNLESATWGHIGNNHLHVNILPRDSEDYKTGTILYSIWADEIAKMGGAISAEHGVGKLKSYFLEVMYGSESIEQMTALKYQLDPKGLLSKGNLFTPKKGGEN